MVEIVSGAGYATFINTFRCDPANQDDVVRINIDIVEQVAAHFPGFISAAVHRSTDGSRVFNYLQWESATTSPPCSVRRNSWQSPAVSRG